MPKEHRLFVRISEAEYLPVRVKAARLHWSISVVTRLLLSQWAAGHIRLPGELGTGLSGHPDASEDTSHTSSVGPVMPASRPKVQHKMSRAERKRAAHRS